MQIQHAKSVLKIDPIKTHNINVKNTFLKRHKEMMKELNLNIICYLVQVNTMRDQVVLQLLEETVKILKSQKKLTITKNIDNGAETFSSTFNNTLKAIQLSFAHIKCKAMTPPKFKNYAAAATTQSS